MDVTEEEKDTTDVFVTINGKKYSKPEAIAQLKALGASIRTDASDAKVIEAFNALNDEDEATFLANVTEAE